MALNKKFLILVLGIFLIFLTENIVAEIYTIYTIEESSDEPQPLIYEISHNNPNEWLRESGRKRAELNRMRYDIASELDKEFRDERLKSRNWYAKLDDKLYTGYDVVRFHKGEFDKLKKEKRQKPVSRFALLNGFY